MTAYELPILSLQAPSWFEQEGAIEERLEGSTKWSRAS
jgi:hypothetical protein